VTARVLQFAPRRPKAEQFQPAVWYPREDETPDAFLARVRADCEASGFEFVLHPSEVERFKQQMGNHE
jgi:hypothetical protein